MANGPRVNLRKWFGKHPSILRLAAKMDRGRGQMRWLDQLSIPPPAKWEPDLSDWESRSLSAVWIGHATVLLRIDGMTILTDPVFSNRIGLGYLLGTLGPRRRVAAAMSLRQLPKLDLILISHAHFDHLDRPTLARLDRRTPLVTAAHTSDLIRDLGFRQITELDWGETYSQNGIQITAREVVHWGARMLLDRHRGFNAYLIESKHHRVLYGGDSAYHENFRDIGKVDLAILGIGAYDPYIHAHANPEQALEMAKHMDADFVLPIHHSTFRLSHEPMDEPIRRIVAAAGDRSPRIAATEIGQTWTADREVARPQCMDEPAIGAQRR